LAQSYYSRKFPR
jgi:SAM-dependent methyltransferase